MSKRLDDGRGAIAKVLKDIRSHLVSLKHDVNALIEKQVDAQYGAGKPVVKRVKGRKTGRVSAFAARQPYETVHQWHARIGK